MNPRLVVLPLLFAAQTVLSDGALIRNEWFAGKYKAWSKSKMHSLIVREDGITEFRHAGGGEWRLECFPRIPVRSGEPFTLSCRSEFVTDGAATRPFSMGCILYDAAGNAVSWNWGSASIQPGDSGNSTFLVPNGVAALQPYIFGTGYFAGAFPLVCLKRAEDVDDIMQESDLTPLLVVSSPLLEVSFATSNGVFAVTDRRTGRTWASSPVSQIARRTIVIQSAMRKTMFAARFVDAETLFRYTMVCSIESGSPEFSIMLMSEADTKLGDDPLAFPPPLGTCKGDRVILPYGEGVGVPVDDQKIMLGRYAAFSGSGLSMPFFGVCEDSTGAGWMAVFDTPDDAYALCSRTGSDKFLTVSPGWVGQKGTFGYTRRIRYVFFDKGGYVAMANRYRMHAQGLGLVKTFAEKVKERPAAGLVPGAAGVWYFPGKGDPEPLEIVKELKAAGIERFLWGQGTTERMVREAATIDSILVGNRDFYRDVYHPEQLNRLGWTSGPNKNAWPQDVIWCGEQPQDWLRSRTVATKDGYETHCATMCDMVAPVYARRRILGELSRKPFSFWFIDHAASEPWHECSNPAHPMTRSESRYWRMELLRLAGDDFMMAVGSAKGLYACVPYCDYLEGMLSLDAWSMPRGSRRASFSQSGTPDNVSPAKLDDVRFIGLSPALRLPLWELAYHDCCAAHWSWYDYSNWPLDLWSRRDLFNVLYGTSGLFVFDGGLWKREKARFAASYAVWSAVARKTGFSRMTDHRVLTADRMVQQTVFADGTTVTVNFGLNPFSLPDGTYVAPQTHVVR